MAGQSTYNFFDINNKKKNKNQGATNILSGSSTTGVMNNTATYTNKYTKEMEKLDKELEAEGLKIEKLSDQEKQNYINSLTDTEYERMTQYRDAGYSFGSAKALLELEKQRDNPTNVGGYRGQGFQLAEPLGGMESKWNKSNIIGYLTEKLDDRVQNDVVPALTVSEREKRSQELYDKYSKMTQADWDKLYEQFKNDPKARTFEDDSLDYTLKRYREDQNKSFWDKFRGAGLKISEDENGVQVSPDNIASPTQMISNIPVSALANASAVLRGSTNLLDNYYMLANLLATQEGRDILAYRYLDEEGQQESAEKDPIGWVLDLFDFASLGLNTTSKVSRLGAGGSRLAGAKGTANRLNKTADKLQKTANTMENIADMGISEEYNKILNKALNKLSAGNKGANLLGDYISLTQRPLATIRGGANPKNEKGQQVTANGSWTIGGIQNGVNKVLEGMRNRIQESATGLTPEVRERIRQNPYISDYRERVEAMINDEGAPMDNQKIMEGPIEEVGNELLRRLNEYEARLEENGAEYQVLRSTTKPYDFSNFMNGVYEVFSENGITITPEGELTFSTTANPADMNPVNTARYVIRDMESNLSNMTISQFLDFRKKLRSLINYESDARSTRYSKNIIRQLVDGKLNQLAHKEIPSLAKVDEIYHKQINELKEFKDGLIYQQGEKKGQIKDNFYSIISTLNTQNRQKMKERVERIFPDLGARVEAIRMLPTLVKAYQNSPQMMKALFQKAGFLGGINQSGGVKKAVVGWLLGIVADELFAKPLGEKRRKKAIDELMDEVSPEAIQKLAEIKSKVDAGVELSEQEKRDLATAMKEIALKEYEYLDTQHKKEFDKILESANNQQPKLPAPGMDVISPDGIIKLGTGNPLNSPADNKSKPRNREERVKQVQEENNVDKGTAEEMVDRYEDFMDEVGGDINGNLDTREVNYERFSTKTLEGLMKDSVIPQSEKAKIEEVLVKRGSQDETSDWQQLDQEFAYRIMKLDEEEQRVGKVGKNKVSREVAKKQQDAIDDKRDKLVEEMRERYAGQGTALDQQRGEDKYMELAGKGVDYANQYKKSKAFKESEAERQTLNQLKQEWEKTPKFIREMNDNTASKRNEFIDNVEPTNGYTMETTDYNDRYVNKQTGDKGAIKYNEDGTIEVVANNLEGLKQSGILNALPDDTIIRVSGEPERATAGELRDFEYQTVGRANPDERTITAEEGLQTRSYKRDKTIGELADEYGLEKQIVDKIFTNAGEEALGRAKGNLVELAKRIKEGTAPHEVFHAVFNMVNSKRRAEIIDLVMRDKTMTEAEAKEWLADSFSEYFRTGDFDTKPIPKGFVNKVKWFFNKVKEFISGMWSNKKRIRKLFDDIMEGKIDMEELKPNGDYEYQITQKSLFDQEPEISKEELKKEFDKEYNKLLNVLTRSTQSTGIAPQRLPLSLNDTYTPDLKEWVRRMNEDDLENRKGKFNEEKLIDLYYAYEDIANNPKAMQLIRADKDEFHMKPYYELITKMKANPLKIPEGFENEKRLAPLRRALYKLTGTGMEDVIEGYDPDIVERADKLKGRTFSKVSMNELYNIRNLLEDYVNNANLDIPVKGTFNDEGMNELIRARMWQEKGKDRISTYDQKQIKKIGDETEEILKRRLGQVNAYFDKGLTETQEIQDARTDERSNFEEEFIYGLADTYDPNVDKRHKNMKKWFKENLKNYDGFKRTAQYEYLIEPHQLNSLKSKIKEFEKYSYNQINRVYGGTYTDAFFGNLKPRLEEIQAKGTEKAVTNLIALSDMSVDNFERQMKGFGGKSPMPSIAVQDPNVPSGAFGDLTLLFGRETVDPEIDERNKLYGSDAWTPMFPNTRRKAGMTIDESYKRKEIEPIVKDLIKRGADITPAEGEKLIGEIRFFLNRWDMLNQLRKRRRDNNITAINEYVEDIVNDAGESAGIQWSANEDAYYELAGQLSNLITGRGSVDEIDPNWRDYPEVKEIEEILSDIPEEDRKKWMKEFDKRMGHGYIEENTNPEIFARDIDNEIEKRTGVNIVALETKSDTFANVISKIGDMVWKLRNATMEIPDYYFDEKTSPRHMAVGGAVDELIDLLGRVDEENIPFYRNKISDYLKKNIHADPKDILESMEGYYGDLFGNNRGKALEIITQLMKEEVGDRSLTPENVLEAMKTQKVNRSTEPGSFRDMIEIEGTKLNSIEDVRKRNFAKIYHGDRTGDLGDLEKRYNNLIEIISDYALEDEIGNTLGENEIKGVIKYDIADSYDADVKKFRENLEEMDGLWVGVPDEVLQRLIDVVEQGRKIPIRFSESKPERVVDLTKEVKYILVPKRKKSRVEKIVKGTPLEGKVIDYKEDNNIPYRTKKIKELQKKYGDVFFSMGGLVMPIAMLYMMMEGDDEGEGQQA